ncbi:rCG62708 [Rattus norvegicus]|uniref:RCG62708 n=1 Tax=Rattus norvegicus TaxID=10116 RepID=A6J5K2_RAT|nr:rCG62708 [Rattus norvegicus]
MAIGQVWRVHCALLSSVVESALGGEQRELKKTGGGDARAFCSPIPISPPHFFLRSNFWHKDFFLQTYGNSFIWLCFPLFICLCKLHQWSLCCEVNVREP